MMVAVRLRGLLVALVIPAVAAIAAGDAAELTIRVTADGGDEPLPARIHVVDEEGEPHRAEGLPFWHDAFVCEGAASLAVAAGEYAITVEKGPEWSAHRERVVVANGPGTVVRAVLRRLADLKAEGWHGGDLHVHRPPDEMPLHLRAEDLSVASVQTWWNRTNAWGGLTPPDPVEESDGRFYHVLGGEDERGGGALLYHRMGRPIDITGATREWPASTRFLEEADAAGAWIEIEKPFWWDAPLWLATGRIDSVGLAHNHLHRAGVLGNEAWGRPRDAGRWPGAHGNGRYTLDLYHKILNSGLRIPPSAGSASGVLANPVGYNRVYVHTGGRFSWDAWWEGLREGRCFVTNGPLLRLTANGRVPGATLAGDDALVVTIEGALDSRDPIRAVELVENGVAREIELPGEFIVEESGWFLVRAIADLDETFRFAATAPWFVEIGGRARPPDRAAAIFFRDWAVERKAMVGRAIEDPGRRREVVAAHEAGIALWEEIVARAKVSKR